MKTYKPVLSKIEVQKRIELQTIVNQNLESIKEKLILNILGKDIISLSGLFAPNFEDSKHFAQAVKDETKDGDNVLDMRTGTGIQGIFAAEKASKVTSVDINPVALECAKQNVQHHHLKNKITILNEIYFQTLKKNLI